MKKIMFTGDNLTKDERIYYANLGYQIDAYDTNLTNKDIIKLVNKKTYDGYILGGDEILDKDTIGQFYNSLKVISFYGVGYQTYINEESATKKGIVITNTPGTNTNAVAEHTIALLLSATRNIVYNNEVIRNGGWSKEKLNDLCGLKIGIIGMGAIGTQVAKKLYYCFKPQLFYYNRTRKEDLEKEIDLRYSSLSELYKQCDVILVHCAATEETVSLIDDAAFDQMKSEVILINTARATIVNENALFKNLENGKIKVAAFDVFYKEPVDFKNDVDYKKFAKFIGNQLVVSPHTAYYSNQALEDMKKLAIQNCIDVLSTGKCKNIVNKVNIQPAGTNISAEDTRIYILEDKKYVEKIYSTVKNNINAKSIEIATNLRELFGLKSLTNNNDKKILMVYSDLVGEGEELLTKELATIKNLYAVCYGCTYLDGLDLAWCKKNNIVVTTLDDYRIEQRAELMFYIIQSTINRIAFLIKNPSAINNQNVFSGVDLKGIKVGFLGCTEMTNTLAKKLKSFGMDISYYSEQERCIDLTYKDIQKLLKDSEVIITAGYTGFEQYQIDKYADLISKNAYVFSCEQGQQNVNKKLFIKLAEEKKILGYGFTSTSDKVTDFAENIYCISDNTWASPESYSKLCDNWVQDVKSVLTNKAKNVAK